MLFEVNKIIIIWDFSLNIFSEFPGNTIEIEEKIKDKNIQELNVFYFFFYK